METQIPVELAKYGIAGIAIALIVLIGYFFKLFFQLQKEMAERSERSFEKLSRAIDRNTEVTRETKDFLSNLNGRLVKTIKEKLGHRV